MLNRFEDEKILSGRNLKLKEFGVEEIWSWNIEVEIWICSWNLKLKYQVEIWSWKWKLISKVEKE